MRRFHSLTTWPIPQLSIAASVLAACSMAFAAAPISTPTPTPTETKAAPSPVVATVDGQAITLNRVRMMAWRLSQQRPNEPPVTEAQALDQLIDLQLQAQQAQKQSIDSLPAIVELMAITRMEVLAGGLNDTKRQSQVQPDDAQIKAYYERNPDLFSRRKVFAIQELQVESSPWDEAEMRRQVGRAKDMKTISAALTESGAKLKANNATQAAENLPLEILPELSKATEGKPYLKRNAAGKSLVYAVVATRSEPKTLAEATLAIKLFLSNKGWIDQSAKALSELKQKAHIERLPLPSSDGFTFKPE